MSKRLAKYSLRNEKGVTILMALFALLVVVMISTVILSAALSAVHQSKADQELQQGMLDLQSASELTAKELTGSEGAADSSRDFKIMVTSTSTDNVNWKVTGVETTDGVAYAKAIEEAVKELYYSDTSMRVTTSTPREFVVTASYGNATAEDYSERVVDASFVIKDIGDVSPNGNSLVFTFETEADDEQKPQRLFLRLTGNRSSSTVLTQSEGADSDSTTEWTRTDTYTWSSPYFYTSEEGEVSNGDQNDEQ